MRTVTFSNDKIAGLVNDNFVATWVNRNPKFHNCDLTQERHIVSNSFECFATKNFCTFFVTPDLEVLHYLSGYYSPGLFQAEMGFVQELGKEVCDDRGLLRKDRLSAYRWAHEKHAAKHKEDRKAVNAAKAPKRGEPGYEAKAGDWNARRSNLAEGLGYLERVHGALQKHSVRKARPYVLDEVIKNYMGGNEFTEE